MENLQLQSIDAAPKYPKGSVKTIIADASWLSTVRLQTMLCEGAVGGVELDNNRVQYADEFDRKYPFPQLKRMDRDCRVPSGE